MGAFKKRFFVCIALIFLGFTAISFEIKNLIFFPIFAFSVVVFYVIMSKSRNQTKNLKLICCLLILAAIMGTVLPQTLIQRNENVIKRYSGEHRIEGYVKDVSYMKSFMCEYVVRVEKADGKSARFEMVLVADYACELSEGDSFALDGEITPLESYDELAYLKNKNSHDYPIICSIDESDTIEYFEREFRVSLMLSDTNDKFSESLIAILGKDAGELASALLLGNRDLLSDSVLRDFKRAGVYHMLALSGLHVAILIGIFEWLLKKLCFPRSVRICALTLLSLFYVALTGFALSACRSMLMLWVMYLALTLGKKRDAMTALFLAVTVIALINPSAILDIGLQLSFLSTFGVISASIIGNKIKWFKKDFRKQGLKAATMNIIRKLALINLASLCVFISTLPVIMIYFGEVSLATFISNLFMGIVCEIFMIFALLTLIFSFNPYLRFPFAEIAVRAGNFMRYTVSVIADIDGIMLSLLYPCAKILVFGLFVGFLVLFAVKLKRQWLIFVPCILFAVVLPIVIVIYGASRNDFVRAEYLRGDNIILSSSSEVYICDLSGGAYGALYESVEIARENCFTEIDGIILTHYHSRHVVSLGRLARNYKIHGVLLPMPQNSKEDLIMRSIVRVLESEDVNVYIYDDERELDILNGKLNVSPRAYIAGYAHPSVAMSFAYGNKRITLVGKPYFETYLEKSGVFEEYLKNSDYLIFGSDGRNPQNDFTIFENVKNGCEISFSEFELMNKSDFEEYLDKYSVYLNVEYKKYDLK